MLNFFSLRKTVRKRMLSYMLIRRNSPTISYKNFYEKRGGRKINAYGGRKNKKSAVKIHREFLS